MRASSALGGGSRWHWCIPETRSNHTLAQLWLSSWCSSTMYSSMHSWGSSLGASMHFCQYTFSDTPRISWSVGPRRVLMKWCSQAVSLAMSVCYMWGHLLVHLSHSLLYIAAIFWHRCSNRKSPNSWWWVVQPGWSLSSLSRYSWPWRAHSATLFEHPVLRVSCFIHSSKVVKLPYCSITNSSIIQ